jgi:hypothetical protein
MKSESAKYFPDYLVYEGSQFVNFLRDRGVEFEITLDNCDNQIEKFEEAITDYATWVYARENKLTVFEAIRDVLIRRAQYQSHLKDFPNHKINLFKASR